MKVKFLGHAAFLITSDSGIRIITDPYKPGCFDGGIQYGQITETADIVTISHEHDDHNDTNINGDPIFVRNDESQEIKGIKINGIKVFHDTSGGSERGTNVIFIMNVDGINIAHLGDLGHELSDDEIKKIGSVDVVLVPIGGYFTIDTQTAEKIVTALKPKIVIPMHYKTEKCGFPIAPLESFVQNKEIKKCEGEVEICKGTLPTSMSIYVLAPVK